MEPCGRKVKTQVKPETVFWWVSFGWGGNLCKLILWQSGWFQQFEFGFIHHHFMSCIELQLRKNYAGLESRSWSNSIGLPSSGPPRQDTLRPGEGKWSPESDGPLASGASAESNGGMRNVMMNLIKKKQAKKGWCRNLHLGALMTSKWPKTMEIQNNYSELPKAIPCNVLKYNLICSFLFPCKPWSACDFMVLANI